MSKKDIYTFGMCKICKQNKPLKNGICFKCEEKQANIPKFLKDIFGDSKNE
jgi:hypothetical protein